MAEYENPLIAEAEPIEVDNIGNLAQLMVSELVGCPDLLIRQQLQHALREFCKATGACVIKFRVPVVEGQYVYRIGRVPCDMLVNSLNGVKCGLRVLQEGYHYEIIGDDLLSVRLTEGAINRGDELEFSMSVFPKVGGETCPEWFKSRYADAIVAGAMFYLMKMDGKPWVNASRMSDYANEWQNAINEAAYKRMMGSPVSNASGGALCPSGGLFI